MKNSLRILFCASFLAFIPGQGIGAEADVDTSYDPAPNDTVTDLAHQADGKILVSGNFTSISGQSRSVLVRLNTDGSLDSTFNHTIVGRVEAIVPLANGQIVVGGNLSSVGGSDRGDLVRLNADGSVDAGFSPNVSGSVWTCIVQPDGKIVIGGTFNFVGGMNSPELARLNSDGTFDSSFNVTVDASAVRALALEPDGDIIFGGGEMTVNGQERDVLARVSSTGALDPDFNPTISASSVTEIVVQPDGQLLMVGGFTNVNSGTLDDLARLNPDGTTDTSFTHSIAANGVNSIHLQVDGNIVVGANTAFFTTSTPNGDLFKLSSSGILSSSFNLFADFSGLLRTVLITQDGNILGGGDFSSIGGVSRANLVQVENTPATESLDTISTNAIQWLRGGSSPEVDYVTFEYSADGTNWNAMGQGVRGAGGWFLTGLSLNNSGQIRARGFKLGGGLAGNAGIYEKTLTYQIKPEYNVSFDLAGKGTRSGGGLLNQVVVEEQAAIEPLVNANPGWTFDGWDVAFDSVTSDLTVTAQYLVDYDNTQPDQDVPVTEDRPGEDASQPTNVIEAQSMTVAEGNTLNLGPNEVIELNGGALTINPGAVFEGTGTILGEVINAGLMILRIVNTNVTLPQITNNDGFLSVINDQPTGGGAPLQINSAVDNSATFSTDGSLEITGTFTQSGTGTLRLFAEGEEPGVSYSQLTVRDNVSLDGEIQLVLDQAEYGLFSLQPGDSFDLVRIDPEVADRFINLEPGISFQVLATQAIESQINAAGLATSAYTPTETNDPDTLVELGSGLFSFVLEENGTILRATFQGTSPPNGDLNITSRIPSVDTDPASDAWESANGFDPAVNDLYTLDSDGDGDPDIRELFQGTGSTASGERFGFQQTGADGATQTLSTQFRRSTLPAATDEVMAVNQWSTDQVNWYESGESDGNIIVTITEEAANETGYQIVDVDVTVTTGQAPKLFYRLNFVPVE
jgi:uncharacterized delta-60 repeat protein